MDHSSIGNNSIISAKREMSARIQTYNWSVTPLGKPEGWSQFLKMALQTMLHTKNPSFIWWGQDLIQLHNDAYAALLQKEHAPLLGQSARVTWAAVWEQVLPIVAQVFSGTPLLGQDLQVLSDDFAGNIHWAFSYQPILEDDGSVGGILATGYEVPEIKVAESMLNESKERYRAFVTQSSEAIWRFELEQAIPTDLPAEEQIARFYQYGYLGECNDAMAKMYGYEKAEEIIGTRLGQVLSASDPSNINYLRAFIESNYRLTDAESNEVDRNGQPRYFLNNLTGIIDGGQLLRAWGTQRDITKRKRAEENIRLNNERFQIAEQAVSGFYYDWNLQTDIVTRSANFTKILGYEDGEIDASSTAWQQICHPDDLEWLRVEVATNQQHQRKEYALEYRVRHKAGHWVYLLDQAQIFRNDAGALERIVGISIDITERKQAETEVAQLNERNRTILESITDAFFAVDRDWNFTHVNQKAHEVLQRAPGTLTGKNVWAEFPEAIGSGFYNQYHKAVNDQVAVTVEEFYPPLNTWFEVRAYPSGDGLSVYFHNINARKEAEQAIRESEERLRLAVKNSGIVLAGMDTQLRYTWVINPHPDFNEQAVIGKTDEDLLPVEQVWQFTAIKKQVLASGTGSRTEVKVPLSDKLSVYDFVAEPLLDDSGNIVGITTAAIDITERKQIEEAIRESNERYHTLFNSIDEGFCICEMLFDENDQPVDYRFLEVNPIYIKLTELTDPVGKTGRELVPNLEEKWFEIYGQVVKTGEPIRFESHLEAWNKWYDLHVSRIGRPEERKFAILFNDISERKENEARLRDQERELRTLANTIPQLAWMAEPNGYIFWYNDRWYEYTGTNPAQMEGWGWQSVHDPAMLPQVVDKWTHSIKTGKPFEMEFPLRGADGNFRWFLTRIIPFHDAQGNLIRWFGTNTDVDEIRRMREAITEREQQLQDLANAMPQVVWIADPQGNVYYYNKRVLGLDGIVQTAAGHWEWQPVLHPDDEMPTLLAWQKAVQEKSIYAYEHRLRMKDGSYCWHLSRGFPVLDENGDVVRWYGTATEVEDLKQTQQELLENKIRFQYVTDTAPVLIWQAGLDKGCYYFNKGWLDFTGRTLEQEQGNGWVEGVHPDDFERCLDIYTTAFDQEEEFAMEYRLRHHDGTYRWIYDRGIPTYDHLGNFTGYMGGCIDVHERIIAEEQKDAFIRIAGHELRTPLTSLIGYLNLIQKSEDRAESQRFVQKSYASALKMRGLINDFLFFSNTKPGAFSFKFSEFAFDRLVSETVENFKLSYPQYEFTLQGKTDKIVTGDQSRIEQVVANLLSNAIKYAPDERRVEITLAARADQVLLKIRDFGIGIEPEDLDYIFDRFYRAKNTGKIKGMGLGLFIVKEIVDYHQGTIRVESEPGAGTIFTVELPAASPAV